MQKKIFGESNFKSNFLGFDSENFKFAYINNFLENVKNGFELILWLKKGGWSYTRGGLIRGILRYLCVFQVLPEWLCIHSLPICISPKNPRTTPRHTSKAALALCSQFLEMNNARM